MKMFEWKLMTLSSAEVWISLWSNDLFTGLDEPLMIDVKKRPSQPATIKWNTHGVSSLNAALFKEMLGKAIGFANTLDKGQMVMDADGEA